MPWVEPAAINYNLFINIENHALTHVLFLSSRLLFSSKKKKKQQIHDDLEKEPEYSGSGFGPDDEDSNTNQHKKPTPHQKTSKDKATNVKNTQTPEVKHMYVDGDDEDGLGGSGDKSETDYDDKDDDVSERTFGKGQTLDGNGEEDDKSVHTDGGTNFNKATNYNGDGDDDLTTVIEEKTIQSSKIKHFNFFSFILHIIFVSILFFFVFSSTTNIKCRIQNHIDLLILLTIFSISFELIPFCVWPFFRLFARKYPFFV